MNNILQFVWFKDFDNWNVRQYMSVLFQSKYNITLLKKCIKAETIKIKPFDFPNDNFKILGVNNKTGLFDNEIKKGSKINQSYKVVKNGFLAYNPYRINVGSIGLKSNKQEYDLISPAYVVFSCLDNLFPEYLFLIFKTNEFNQIIKNNTRGSVRQILAYDILENLQIPLPPLEIQQQLVKNYQDKINLAKQQEEQSKQKEAEIETYLYKELGIELPKEEQQNQNILQFANFKGLQCWGVSKQKIKQLTGKYNFINMEDCCSNFRNGVNFNKSQFGKGVKFVNIKNVYSDKYVNLEYLDRISINKNKIEQNLLLDNDLVFVRSSVKYEGVGFPSLIKLNNKNDKIVFCGFIIKCSIDIKIISPDFMLYVLRSNIYRNIIISKSNKSTITNIAQPALKSLQIPVPPLEIQNKIASHIQNIKNEIQVLKQQAEQNKKDALNEFETEIFTNKMNMENNNAT
jgi:type I restriction enzyme S subunit